MTILCLSGRAGVGKDTMAEVLVRRHNFTRVALADPVRELCSKVFRIPYDNFLEHGKKDEEVDKIFIDYHHLDKMREIIENDWNFPISYEDRENMEEYYGEEFNTLRSLMRFVANNLCRNFVRNDIFVLLAMEKIRKLGGNIVISDCRMSYERDIFSRAGGLLCLIKRDTDREDDHITENDLGEEEQYDVIFHNNGTKHQFQSDVDLWFSFRKEELTNYRVFKYD